MWKVSNYRGGKLSTQSYNATFFFGKILLFMAFYKLSARQYNIATNFLVKVKYANKLFLQLPYLCL